jgi:hypothetical protein
MQSRVMYVGPKGPGKNEKISRCSWIFKRLRSFLHKIPHREKPFPNINVVVLK